jgi:hypothetical protein
MTKQEIKKLELGDLVRFFVSEENKNFTWGGEKRNYDLGILTKIEWDHDEGDFKYTIEWMSDDPPTCWYSSDNHDLDEWKCTTKVSE